jgi:L-threonylcarbamoyladenylate synthase
MVRLRKTEMNPEIEAQIRAAIEIIKRGGTVIYPTETVYGLGADAFSEPAVRKVYELKGREPLKPISIAVSSFEMLQTVAYVDAAMLDLLRALLPGPVTVLLRKKERLPDLLTAGSEVIGVRFPDHEIALRIIRETGPITATSANVSGRDPPTRDAEVALAADLLIKGGRCNYSMPSTVVALTRVAANEAKGEKELAIKIEVKRRGAGYDRVLHVLRSKALGEGLHRFSVSELR